MEVQKDMTPTPIPGTTNLQYIDENGFLRTDVIGDQTVEGIETTFKGTPELVAQMKAAGKPILLINNLLGIGKESSKTRAAVTAGMKSIATDKIAVVTQSFATRYGANFIMRVSGQYNTTRFFATLDGGLAFLKSYKAS